MVSTSVDPRHVLCVPLQILMTSCTPYRSLYVRAKQGTVDWRNSVVEEGSIRGMQDKARQGKARQGKARQGKARQGKARQGKARQKQFTR